jgi:hypothetical protein
VEIRFDLCDCRPSGRWRARRNTTREVAPFVQIRVLMRNVTPRHRKSDLHGNPNYVVFLPSDFTCIGQNCIHGGEECEPHQSSSLPQHPVIGNSPALADWPVA